MLSFSRNRPHISNGYAPLSTNEEIDDIEESLLDDDFALPAHPDEQSNSRTTTESPPSGNQDSSIFKKVLVFILTNTVVSLCILVIGVAASLSPGIYAMFIKQPPPILDKSVKAFDIPNHKVSLRDEALSMAMRDLYHSGRKKRDASDQFNLMQSSFLQSHDQLSGVNSDSSPHLHGAKQFDAFSWENGKNRFGSGRDDESSQHPRSVLSILKRRKRRSGSSPFLIKGDPMAQTWKKWTMTLVYLASDEDENNIFTSERLNTIHEIEQLVLNHPDFSKFCYKNYSASYFDATLTKYGGCTPPNSLLTYFYPSQIDGRIFYDGLGSKQHNINDALSLAMTKDSFYWYVDVAMNSTNRKSRLLRTEVYFGAPLPGYHSWHNNSDMQLKQFKNFLVDLIQPLKKASTSKVRVLYGGNEIFDYEVEHTFWNDIRLASVSLTLITLLMFVLTSCSLWLTFWGIASIVLCIFLTLGVYRLVLGFETLGILNGAAAFLIIGIGVDDVFVFINTFRQASHCTNLGDRMIHTVSTAGKATFFTSFTTAAAFAANLASSIPALHEFGAFMSLIVCCCWVMVVILMPPALNLWYRFISHVEFSCFKHCMKCNQESSLALPSDVAEFIASGHQSSDQTTNESRQSNVDDDVPMFELELSTNSLDNDVPMLDLEDQWTMQTQIIESDEDLERREGCDLTSKIQTFMYYYIALPVIKLRWFILGGFIVVLAISIGLLTQLHAATRPPLLFKSGTNLQMFMDLKTNLSAEGISCDVCSGFFLEIPTDGKVQSQEATGKATRRPPPKSWWTPAPAAKPTMKPHIPPGKPTKHPVKVKTTTTTTTKPTPVEPHKSTIPVLKPTIPPRPTHGMIDPASKPRDKSLTTPKTIVPSPVDPNLPLCTNDKCDEAAERPNNLESSAMVYVVFGIKGVDNSNVTHDHVFSQSGVLNYDNSFSSNFNIAEKKVSGELLKDLCRICKMIANTAELVKPGSAQCLPYDPKSSYQSSIELAITALLAPYEECKDLPGIKHSLVGSKSLPDRARANLSGGKVLWMTFAFESTTDQGQSYFTAYQQYLKWERLIDTIKEQELPEDSPLQSIFQTSHFWRQVMMEIVAVTSAVYGLVLSMVICVAAVAIFTAHVKLLLVTCLTILGEICMVVAVFYMAGWELGAVEAVSLSILVGTSVDYCVHLVEAYLLAGKRPPAHAMESDASLRQWRTSAALSHIGVSILSSAITTVCASIPLTQTIIEPFSKFGQIVAINITVSIIYTLTACTAFLALFAPANFTSNWKAALKAFVGTLFTTGVLVLILFIIDRAGAIIPGPDGNSLFPQ